MEKRNSKLKPFVLVFALLAAGAISGCHVGQPASASFASVIIASKSADEIRQATAAVFMEAGYGAAASGGGEMVFEKEGTRMNQIAHGGWIEDSTPKQRVRAQIVPLTDGTNRLQCRAYIVRHAGDSFFEDEVRLSNLRSGPYQKLLEQTAARLK